MINIGRIMHCFNNIKNKNKVIKNDDIFKNKYFLIVDDNEINIKIIKKYLTILGINKKYIFHAKNGEIALNIYNKYTFDVIISDIEMPICDGFQMVNRLKINKVNQINQNKNLPIIFMTASQDELILNKIKMMNIPYMLKPINKNILYILLIELIINNTKNSPKMKIHF